MRGPVPRYYEALNNDGAWWLLASPFLRAPPPDWPSSLRSVTCSMASHLARTREHATSNAILSRPTQDVPQRSSKPTVQLTTFSMPWPRGAHTAIASRGPVQAPLGNARPLG